VVFGLELRSRGLVQLLPHDKEMQLTPVLRPPQADLDGSASPHSTKVDQLDRRSHFVTRFLSFDPYEPCCVCLIDSGSFVGMCP
jgi:hypothetical protein